MRYIVNIIIRKMKGVSFMILPKELMELISQGEGITVEFKKSTTDITKDVYDTVCQIEREVIFSLELRIMVLLSVLIKTV